MTLSRQPIRVLSAVALGAALYAAPGQAQELASPPAPQAAPAAPSVPAPAPQAAPKAPAAKGPWLRSKAAPVAAAAPVASTWRLVALGAVVAGLGAAALFQRRRRTSLARAVRSDLTVMSAVRVGNKAQVVVVNVGGRKLLLGVTEAEVSRLAWLDGDLEAAGSEADIDVEGALAASAARGSLNSTELFAPGMVPTQPRTKAALPTQEAQPPRRFRELLFNALGHDSRPATNLPANAAFSAADEIAEGTRDFVSRASGSRVAAPAGAPDMVDIEGQARGLILRLQKRA